MAESKELSFVSLRKLRNFFQKTLDTNQDGIVNWEDFKAAVETMVPLEEAEKNSRLKIVRKRLEQNFQTYFWDLCAIGDANKDGNIDLDEWLNVIVEIIDKIRREKKFPDWYEGLHKALWRSQEFMDEHGISKEEFINMMFVWDIDEDKSIAAYDYITQKGTVKLNYTLFDEFMKQFFLNEEKGHPVNLGLDL